MVELIAGASVGLFHCNISFHNQQWSAAGSSTVGMETSVARV